MKKMIPTRRFVRASVLAGNMDVNDAFERLYQSIVQQQEKYNVGCVSGDSQNSSTEDLITSSQSSTSQSQRPGEMFTLYSKRLNTESQSYRCGKSVMSTNKRASLSVYINEAHKTSSTTSNGKPASAVKRQNGDEPLHEEHYASSYDTRCSDIEYSHESVDGYESGEVEEHSDKQYVCKECTNLFKKARKSKPEEVIPRKPDHRHWRCKYWMMMSRFSSQKANKRKKTQNRTMKSVVNKLRTKRQTAKVYRRCCRIHSFLKRNLRTSTKKQPFPNLKGKRKRKRMAGVKLKEKPSAQKSFQTSTIKEKEKSFSYTIEKKVTKETVMFELDCSDEEETTLNVKRYKYLDDDLERSHFQKLKENPLPMADEVEPINTWQEQNSPIQGDVIDSPATQNKDYETCNQRFNINPQDTDESVGVAGHSPFSHVQSGSFKELLQRMNLGCFRSGIVRENRL